MRSGRNEREKAYRQREEKDAEDDKDKKMEVGRTMEMGI